MRSWKKQNPDSYCLLQYDKLYIDNRLYAWDKEAGEVVEQEGEADSRKSSSSSRPSSSMIRWEEGRRETPCAGTVGQAPASQGRPHPGPTPLP